MSHSHASNQTLYGLLVENIPDHTIRLALIEATFRSTRNYSTCILSSMLQQREALTDFRRSVGIGVMQKKTKNSTH